MPLTGTYARAVDEKGRVTVPSRLRDQLDDPQTTVLYLAPGTDRCLSLYTEKGLERLANQLAQSPPTRTDVRTFLRLFYAQAQRVEIDMQSRIRLPERLTKLAGIDREVVVIGVQDHMEVWDRKRWDVYVEENSPRFDTIAEGAFRSSS